MRTMRCSVCSILFATLLVACGDGDSSTPSTGDDGGADGAIDAAVDSPGATDGAGADGAGGSGEVVIGTGGGPVTSDDGRVVLDIPAGALRAPTTIRISRAAMSAPGAVGPVYEISPPGLTLARKARVTARYDGLDLHGGSAGDLALAGYTGGRWVDLEDRSLDTDMRRASGLVERLDAFALVTGLCAACASTCDPATCRFGADMAGMGGVAGKCVAFGNGCGRCVPTCDGDGDGFCPGTPTDRQPGNDCNDANARIYPRALEVCGNRSDDDCDGHVDEGCTTCAGDDQCKAGFEACLGGRCEVCANSCTPTTCTFGGDRNVPGSGVAGRCHAYGRGCTRCVPSCDVDGDGACPGNPGQGQTGNDCNDANPAIHGGASEVCGNNADDDCDGQVDEGCDRCATDAACTRPMQACVDGVCEPCPGTCTEATCRFGADMAGMGGVAGKCVAFGNGCGRCIATCDSDADGFCPGSPGSGQPGGDCNDGDRTINPRAIELCGNGRDDDCNNHVDEGCKTCSSDAECPAGLQACVAGTCQVCTASCNPERCRFGEQPGMANSGVAGRCTSFGNGCSACVPACDKDGDGYCPGETVTGQPGGDCNDENRSINPRGREVCGNNVDDDCDGRVDQGCTPCAAAAMCGANQSCAGR